MYLNLSKTKEIKYKTFDYKSFLSGMNSEIDESLLSKDSAKLSYNYNCTQGVLQDGMGIGLPYVHFSPYNRSITKLLDIPSNYKVRKCFLFNYKDEITNIFSPIVVIYCLSGKIYYNYLHKSLEGFTEIQGLDFYSAPSMYSANIDGIDTLILFSKEEGMYTWSPRFGSRLIDSACDIASLEEYRDRLFVTSNANQRQIWFSRDSDPTNFTFDSVENGCIEIPYKYGTVNKLVSFNKNLYVFTDNSIIKVTSKNNTDTLAYDELYISSGKINPKSICVCGSKIIFLASDGLYNFANDTITKIQIGINNLFDFDNSFADCGYLDGNYYLTCRIKLDNEELPMYTNNALIKLKIATNSIEILKGYNIYSIAVINDKAVQEVMLMYRNADGTEHLGMLTNSGAFFETPTTKVFNSPQTDFGYPFNRKYISELKLETKSDCIVQIVVDGKTNGYSLRGEEGIQFIKPRLKGYNISLIFISNKTNTKISNVSLKVGIL